MHSIAVRRARRLPGRRHAPTSHRQSGRSLTSCPAPDRELPRLRMQPQPQRARDLQHRREARIPCGAQGLVEALARSRQRLRAPPRATHRGRPPSRRVSAVAPQRPLKPTSSHRSKKPWRSWTSSSGRQVPLARTCSRCRSSWRTFKIARDSTSFGAGGLAKIRLTRSSAQPLRQGYSLRSPLRRPGIATV